MEKHTDNKEKILIHSLKQGSQNAFDEIYQMYSKRLYAYSLQFTKSPEDAEEIVQDVFIKLWTNREIIRQDETLRSLLFIMAKHHLINAYRSKINHPLYEDYSWHLHDLSVNNTHYHVEYNELVQRIKQIMKTLTSTQQKVIKLSRLQQLSNKEIAKALSLSEQTVKNQLSLGLKIMKEKLNAILTFAMLFFLN